MELRFQDPTFHDMEFTLKFLRSGKVVVKIGNGRYHYTLHPGEGTGVIDLHRTDELRPPDDPVKYERLWALPQDVLIERLTVAGYSLFMDFWGLWRPLRLGWMIRRQLAIGPRIPIDLCYPEVTAIKTREGAREANDPLEMWMKPPEFYEDILSEPNSGYLLYDNRKRSSTPYGVLITYGQEDSMRMLWARTRDLNRWSRKWEPLFLSICNVGQDNSGSHQPSPRDLAGSS
jgi:hypothetical protein